jgi:O-antigen ligase
VSSESTTGIVRRRARIGTMVWGAILVGVAIFAILALQPGTVGTAAVLWSVVGFGGFLLLGAVATAVVRAATTRAGETANDSESGTGTDAATGSGHPPIG